MCAKFAIISKRIGISIPFDNFRSAKFVDASVDDSRRIGPTVSDEFLKSRIVRKLRKS